MTRLPGSALLGLPDLQLLARRRERTRHVWVFSRGLGSHGSGCFLLQKLRFKRSDGYSRPTAVASYSYFSLKEERIADLTGFELQHGQIVT